MKKLLFLIALMLLFGASASAQKTFIVKLSNEQKARLDIKSRNGELRVSFAQQHIDLILEKIKISKFEQAFPSAQFFDYPAKENILSIYKMEGSISSDDIGSLKGANFFEFIHEDFEPEPTFTPSDWNANYQQIELDVIRARQAWDITQGSSSIKIAIVDNGFNPNHEDLASQIVYQHGDVNYYGSGASHGNQVAGVAAARTNNGSTGITSIGFNSKLMLYKYNGAAADFYDKMLLASSHGARVINCSFNAGCSELPYQQDIVNMILANGSVIVASSGNGTLGSHCSGDGNGDGVNDNGGYLYPASYNGVISVGGTEKNDTYYKNSGPHHFTFNDKVDLTAPGYSIFTTSDVSYTASLGTSFSTPMVAGTVALMLAVKSCLRPSDVEFILKMSTNKSVNNSSTFPENAPFVHVAGTGRLDAYEAVRIANGWPATFSTSGTITGPATVCSSATFSINNNVSSGVVTWTSANTSALTINSSGVATRVGSYVGQVSITAKVTGPCGTSSTISRIISVGAPTLSVGTSNMTSGGWVYHTATAQQIPGTVSSNYKWYEEINGSPTTLIATGFQLYQWPVGPC